MNLRITATRLGVALVAASPLAALAQSNVTLYGIVDSTVRFNTNGPDASGSKQWSVGDGAYTGSRFGMKGSEDLGNGTKALFSLEGGFDPSNGVSQQASGSSNYGQAQTTGGRLFGREALVGLSGKLGTLTLGRQYTLAHQLSGRFQPQSNPNQDSLSVFSGHHISRQDNMAKYALDIGSFNVAASVTAGERQYGNSWGVGGAYKAGPLDLVAYHSQMHSVNDTEIRKITGVGGSFAITKDVRGFAGFMKRDHRVSLQENRVYTVGVNYSLTPQVQLTAQHTQDRGKSLGAAATSGTRKVTFIGAGYAFSKRTDVYAEVDTNKLSGGYTQANVRPSFMGPTKNSQNGMSVGIRHRF